MNKAPIGLTSRLPDDLFREIARACFRRKSRIEHHGLYFFFTEEKVIIPECAYKNREAARLAAFDAFRAFKRPVTIVEYEQ